jgi:hypothetical protein
MPFGPGKYGPRAARLLAEVNARAVLVVTIGGDGGHAFDLATTDPVVALELPDILRRLADAIEREAAPSGRPS